MSEPLLELRGVNKSFGVVHVLHDVDFAVFPGQVTALVGDNGAGKSTLAKIIAGIYGRDTGDYFFEGQPVSVHGPRDVAALGVEVVYQDLALCDNLDIVENMFLGREETNGHHPRRGEHGVPRPRDPDLPVGAHRPVGAPERGQPLRRPAPDGRDRQGRALELQDRAARRTDRRPRRRPDPPGPRPGAPAGRPRARRRAHLAQHDRRASRSPTGSPRSTWAGSPPTSPAKDVTHSQVVELITAGRSGEPRHRREPRHRERLRRTGR